jgi:hypothetical protein
MNAGAVKFQIAARENARTGPAAGSADAGEFESPNDGG